MASRETLPSATDEVDGAVVEERRHVRVLAEREVRDATPFLSAACRAMADGMIDDATLQTFVGKHVDTQPLFSWLLEQCDEQGRSMRDVLHVAAPPERAHAAASDGEAEGRGVVVEDSEPEVVAVSPAGDDDGDDDVLVVSPPVADAPSAQISLAALRGLSNAFPPPHRGQFRPSPLQHAVLEHMAKTRARLGHRTGLVVLATACGKTVLGILDLHRELARYDGGRTLRRLARPRRSDMRAFVRRGGGRGTRDRSSSSSSSSSESESDEDFQPVAKRARPVRRRAGTGKVRARARRKGTAPVIVLGDDDDGGGDTDVPPFKFLFLVHTRAIRDTAHAKFGQHFRALGFPASALYNVDGKGGAPRRRVAGASFVFCLFQGVDAVAPALDSFTHVLVDECHHLMAPSFRAIHDALVRSPSLVYMLGITATLFHRVDTEGLQLRAMFRDTLFIDFPWTTAKAHGVFPRVEYLESLPTLASGRDIATYASMASRLTRHGSVVRFLRELEASVTHMGMGTTALVKRRLTPEYVVDVFSAYQRSRELNGLPRKRHTIFFAASVRDANRIAALLGERGVRALVAHYKARGAGAGPGETARQNFAQFAAGRAAAIVTVSMLNEGFDAPCADCLVLARWTESELVFVQQMGRGLRINPDDADKCVCVLDLALNLRRRWRRLKEDTPDAVLRDQVGQFWHVGNFVGALE